MNWDDLRLLLAVHRSGSFSGAVRDLGINQSTVSRRIHALEARLRARLAERHPDGILLTDAGMELCAIAEGTDAEIELALGRITNQELSLAGPLVVTCVDMMVDRLLAPILAEFQAKHPGVELTILGRMQHMDLIRGQADVALRVSRSPDERLTGRRICDFGLGIYGAARSEAGGTPRGWIQWVDDRRIEARIPQPLLALPVRHKADSCLMLNAMVRAGMGMAVLPCYWADADPALERVHPDPVSDPDLGLWLLFHPDRINLPRVRTFVDFITGRLIAHRSAFSGHVVRSR